jgi:NADP-dependent 3-hydroxy acid dehydrogenase YdfG
MAVRQHPALANKVIWITGASGGIGEALVSRLSSRVLSKLSYPVMH